MKKLNEQDLKDINGGKDWSWIPIAEAILDFASGFIDEAKKNNGGNKGTPLDVKLK